MIAVVSALVIPRICFAEPSSVDVAQARALFNEGLQLRSSGDVAEALEKFRAAYALVETPITGLELGRAYAAVGKPLEAREALLSVARLPVGANESARSKAARTDSDKLAEDLRPRIASLTIKVAGVPTDSVAVSIDGALVPAEALAAPRFLDPGSHSVSARSTSGGAADAQVNLAEGESRIVELKIAPTTGPGLETTQPATSAPPLATHPVSRSEARAHSHVVEWSLIGAGAAVGIAGGILMAVAAGQSQDASDRRDRNAFDAAKTLWTAGLVSAIVGGTSAVAGIVVFVVPNDGARSTASSITRSFWVAGTTGSVQVGGTW